VPHDLPHELSSFLGHTAQITDVAKTLRTARLVTLTGIGGVGKSRVALQVAQAAAPEYAHTAWVQLGSVTDARDIAAAVLQALAKHAGVANEPPASIEPGSGLLLVLDNCEQVITGCAERVHALLERFACVRVLATSREPLGVPGEVIIRIAPLPLPGADGSPEDVVQNDAVRLFVERARARKPGFELTPESSEVVAGICRSLDGIPLAIELAAARITTMTVAEISSRLDDPMELLWSGGRTDAPRHRAFRASLDWSHALLEDAERRVMRGISVFVDSFTSDAAASVCAIGAVRVAQIPALLDRLVAKSLVQAWQQDGAMRFGLFSAVRSYGLSLLAQAGEEDALRDRHLQWCLSLADRGASGNFDTELLSRLRCEEGNLRDALHWAIQSGRASDAMRLALVLGRVWSVGTSTPDGLRPPPSASILVHVALTAQTDLDGARGVPDDMHARVIGTGAESQLSSADRRQPRPLLTESSPAGVADITLMRARSAEEERYQEDGGVVNVRPVDSVHPDNGTDGRNVLAHTPRPHDALPLAAIPPGKSPPLSALSQRELDVVKLVAGGRSNREIAEALVISRKTAEAHVSHILTKLGLWRRVQIATWSLQQGMGLADAE
jgi:non-specific serine/threonine protein kinase